MVLITVLVCLLQIIASVSHGNVPSAAIGVGLLVLLWVVTDDPKDEDDYFKWRD